MSDDYRPARDLLAFASDLVTLGLLVLAGLGVTAGLVYALLWLMVGGGS